MDQKILKTEERKLQRAVHLMLSDPSKIFRTESGKRLQVLSPGIINSKEGPDFLNTAALLGGMITVGNCEFHRRSSDWLDHDHDSDPRYESVAVHIVLENDTVIKFPGEILILDEKEVLEKLKEVKRRKGRDLSSFDELQHFALLRILRKSAEAQKLLNKFNMENAFRMQVGNFLQRYNSRRRRPVYNTEQLQEMVDKAHKSNSYFLLRELASGVEIEITARMNQMLKKKIFDEGSHLRREILLNCVLPLGLCLAADESRIGLLNWFWSTPALNSYGILTRRFPEIPQNYVWQQQGMLECIQNKGAGSGMVYEAVREYGLAELLNFYCEA